MKVVRHEADLSRAGAAAVFVAFDDSATLRRLLLHDLECPYPVVVDPERVSYRAWGLRRVPWPRVGLDPGVWRQYATLLRRGERLRGLGRDPLQLGGDFVVDADGIVVYARPQRRDNRPPVGQLIAALTPPGGPQGGGRSS